MNDLRHSLRLLRRTPGFTAIAVLVLTVGIGANTAVFSLVNALALQPRLGRVDRAVALFDRDRTKADDYRDFAYPLYADLRDRATVFESLMAHTFSTAGIREGDATRQTFVSVVSSNYFETLGVALAAGRSFSADEERPGARSPVAIASYSVWRNAGLSPSFIGSTVHVNGTDFTVVGVAPRGFAGTMTLLSPQWWFPLGSTTRSSTTCSSRARRSGGRGNHALNLVGILRSGMTQTLAGQRSTDSRRSWRRNIPAASAIARSFSRAFRAWASARARRPTAPRIRCRRCS